MQHWGNSLLNGLPQDVSSCLRKFGKYNTCRGPSLAVPPTASTLLDRTGNFLIQKVKVGEKGCQQQPDNQLFYHLVEADGIWDRAVHAEHTYFVHIPYTSIIYTTHNLLTIYIYIYVCVCMHFKIIYYVSMCVWVCARECRWPDREAEASDPPRSVTGSREQADASWESDSGPALNP